MTNLALILICPGCETLASYFVTDKPVTIYVTCRNCGLRFLAHYEEEK